MVWAILADNFDDDPKYADLGWGHMGLIACAISYCNRHLTDGIVPASFPRRRAGASGSLLMRSLIARDILRRRSDGSFEVVGFLNHNRSRADVLADRAKNAENGRKGGLAKARAIARTDRQAVRLASGLALSSPSLSIPREREEESAREPRAVAGSDPDSTTTLPETPRTVDPSRPLSAEGRAFAEMRGVRYVEVTWQAWKDRAIAQGRVAADWEAAWRAACPRIAEYQKVDRAKAAAAAPPDAGNPWEGTRALELRKARERDDAEHTRLAVPAPLADLMGAIARRGGEK